MDPKDRYPSAILGSTDLKTIRRALDAGASGAPRLARRRYGLEYGEFDQAGVEGEAPPSVVDGDDCGVIAISERPIAVEHDPFAGPALYRSRELDAGAALGQVDQPAEQRNADTGADDRAQIGRVARMTASLVGSGTARMRRRMMGVVGHEVSRGVVGSPVPG